MNVGDTEGVARFRACGEHASERMARHGSR